MKFALLNVLRYAYFEAGFVKNLSIFEPQIEKHYASKKKHVADKAFKTYDFTIHHLVNLLTKLITQF